MSLTNTASRYGAVTKSFHWLTALLVLTMIPLGIIANDMAYDTSEQLATKAWLFSLHKTLGVAIFFVALARILWALTQTKPGLLNAEARLEAWAAETVHWLLYSALLLLPLSGWIEHAASTGFAPIWWPFGQSLPFVPKDDHLAEFSGGVHSMMTNVLIGAVSLHILGALKHHFIDRDATLRRMLPGRTEAPAPAGGHRVALPVLSAVTIWALALIGGGVAGFYAEEEQALQAPVLEQVASDWQVQDGMLQITVRQMGSDVTGSFTDWTAAITFDDSVNSGPAGTVEVTVAIASLTLGTVTQQAMGPDFFDTETFPTATFSADIDAVVDGYAALGTLTIKDQSVPVTMPFSLQIRDGVAEMQGTLSLDRRNYGIGDNMKDEGSLGFGVDVKVTLTARQSE